MLNKIIYSANPQKYDYIHAFILKPSTSENNQGKIKLIKGDGQFIRFKASGLYHLTMNTETEGKLEIYGLHSNQETLDYIETNFIIKKEVTILTQEDIYFIKDHLEVNCLLTTEKHIFELDPLGLDKSLSNIYYSNWEIKKRKQLLDEGYTFSNDYEHIYNLFKIDESTKQLIMDECHKIINPCKINKIDRIINTSITLAEKYKKKWPHNFLFIGYYDTKGKMVAFGLIETYNFDNQTKTIIPYMYFPAIYLDKLTDFLKQVKTENKTMSDDNDRSIIIVNNFKYSNYFKIIIGWPSELINDNTFDLIPPSINDEMNYNKYLVFDK